MTKRPIFTLEQNIEVCIYELGNLRDKFDTPDNSNIGRHFAQIKECMQEALQQVTELCPRCKVRQKHEQLNLCVPCFTSNA